MKALARRVGLASYLRTPYHVLVQRPYWRARQLLGLPITKRVSGTPARFWPDPRILRYNEFESERECISAILDSTNGDDVVYDVGANIGIYSCFLGTTGADVVAFEPSPVPYDYLTTNAAFNAGIECHRLALSEEDGAVEFSVDRTDRFGRRSSFRASDAETRYESITVESKRLDTLLLEDGFPCPDVLKIDVEGAEYEVLAGLEDAPHAPRAIFCELHHHRLADFSTSAEEVYDLLGQHGYDVEVLQTRDESDFLKATSS